jgi:tRNA pseudouridine38-40 synthase
MRYFLVLDYNGSPFCGWQRQPGQDSVQERIERALSTLLKTDTEITGAGRTDAGVHARTYVANFRTSSRIPLDRLPLAVNTRLPDDIVVSRAVEVSEGFNAISSCRKKEYTYTIYNSRIRNAFYVDRAWFYPKPLDENIMQAAADRFVGTHDFAAVRSVGTDVRSTVRTVHYFEIQRQGELIHCRVCANGFLYNMVRAMVGTVIYAAEGKFPPEAVTEILEGKCRTDAGPTAPPGGLYMTRLWYDEPGLTQEEMIPYGG